MKYLIIIILIAFSAFADVRIEVTNIKGDVFGSDFETQVELDAWKNKEIAKNSWGKKERWVKFKAQVNCLELRDILGIDENVVGQECKLPVQYTIIETDISAEVAAEVATKLANKTERQEIRAMIQTVRDYNKTCVNASGKEIKLQPAWLKRIRIQLLKDMRE